MDLDIEYAASKNWDELMAERLCWLQRNDPVHWSEKDGLWVVTRFDDVAWVSKHQELFTSGKGVRPGNPAHLGLIDEAEPRHAPLRGLINKGFTPRRVKKLEVSFREIVSEAIDVVAAKGRCDFVHDVAVPLPLLLIADMIGIHERDRGRFHKWSDAMIAADGNMHVEEIMAAASRAFLEYSTYLTEIIEERRREPQDDLVSILVGAKDRGELTTFERREPVRGESKEELTLANDELIMLLTVLLVAGNETTRNGISGGMQLLIEHPDERQKLIDDPALIPMAVEEMLRLVSPVHSFSRTVTENTELAGTPLEKGDIVLMTYPSANRDPEHFENPDVFDITRNPHHLAFGLGSHFCMGANLARMEMRVAFEELLRRLPDMRYAGDGPVIKPSALVRSCVEMQVVYTPESN